MAGNNHESIVYWLTVSFAICSSVICRYDEEGLPVYSTEELNIGTGGNTDQCPFDCSCCF